VPICSIPLTGRARLVNVDGSFLKLHKSWSLKVIKVLIAVITTHDTLVVMQEGVNSFSTQAFGKKSF
jgi:hypothetical protein